MKRIIAFSIAMLLFFSIFEMRAFADSWCDDRIDLGNGYYLIAEEIIVKRQRTSGSVSGRKPYTCYDSSGTALWKVELSGSFTYNGSTATCTASSVSTTVYDSSWSVGTKSAQKADNQAIGSATMNKRSVGVIIKSVPVSLSISCSASGDLN